MDNTKKYTALNALIRECNPDLNAGAIDKLASSKWIEVKKDPVAYKKLINDLSAKKKTIQAKRFSVWSTFQKTAEKKKKGLSLVLEWYYPNWWRD